jgi:hypothetical protein
VTMRLARLAPRLQASERTLMVARRRHCTRGAGDARPWEHRDYVRLPPRSSRQLKRPSVRRRGVSSMMPPTMRIVRNNDR